MGERTNKSPVWIFFDLVETDERFVTCKLCLGRFSRGGVGKTASTTPLLNHIRKMHSYEYELLDLKRCGKMPGSITTGLGAPIVNLPHNHVPDMHAVSLARSRSVAISEGQLFQKGSSIDVIPLMSESFPLLTMPDQDNEHEYEDVSIPEPVLQKTMLKNQSRVSPKQSPALQNPSETPDSPESEMCLRWNSHHANMQTVFPVLMENEQYVDVTLAAEGKLIKCHKLVLSSCSNYFDEMLKNTNSFQQAIIYLRDIKYWQIRALVDFMYKGEVNVDQTKLESLLKAAEDLQIKGLAGKAPKKEVIEPPPPAPQAAVVPETVMDYLEKEIKAESPIVDDDNDEEYFPNPEYRRKYQGKREKGRKRKISVPPDPSLLKHVKINLKGTKSRPNIKQPKFYSPDYPEYDPDRCVSPPKLGSDPVFHIDNIKLEPLDIDSPHSPSFFDSIPNSENHTQSESHNKTNEPASKSSKTKLSIEPKENENRKQIVIESVNKAVEIEPILNKEVPPVEPNKTVLETLDSATPSTSKAISDTIKSKEIIIDRTSKKKTIILKCQNLQQIMDDGTNLQKIIDVATGKQNISDSDKSKSPQIRVRNLPTTDTMLKKFATTQLTSILKKGESGPPSHIILKKVSKPAIFRQAGSPKPKDAKGESDKCDSEIAEKISLLAKTSKEKSAEPAAANDEKLNTEKVDKAETKIKKVEEKKTEDEEEIVPD